MTNRFFKFLIQNLRVYASELVLTTFIQFRAVKSMNSSCHFAIGLPDGRLPSMNPIREWLTSGSYYCQYVKLLLFGEAQYEEVKKKIMAINTQMFFVTSSLSGYIFFPLSVQRVSGRPFSLVDIFRETAPTLKLKNLRPRIFKITTN